MPVWSASVMSVDVNPCSELARNSLMSCLAVACGTLPGLRPTAPGLCAGCPHPRWPRPATALHPPPAQPIASSPAGRPHERHEYPPPARPDGCSCRPRPPPRHAVGIGQRQHILRRAHGEFPTSPALDQLRRRISIRRRCPPAQGRARPRTAAHRGRASIGGVGRPQSRSISATSAPTRAEGCASG